MKTIALINQKGGVGKTTIALHLATAFWQHGRNALVLDLDPQASAAEWHDARTTRHGAVNRVAALTLPGIRDGWPTTSSP